MEKLSLEIVEEILTRLPKPKSKADIETVLQCRKVCRFWRNFLEKPKTGTLFCSASADCSAIEFYYGEQLCDEMVEFNCTEDRLNLYNTVIKIGSISRASMYGCLNLVGSCNGLACYRAYDPKFGDSIYVFNPLTGERIRVLDMGRRFAQYCLGFGYCHSTNAYKVFRIHYIEKLKQGVQVYTLGDGSRWRDIKEITWPTYAFEESGIFANGALHWLNKRVCGCDIVAFDLTDETFRSLPSPPYHNYFRNKSSIGSLAGNLYLCLHYFVCGEEMMDIWVFKKTNMNDCQRSYDIEENTNFNSFTWIQVFSRNGVSGLECRLLSLTESEILLWEDGFLSCYDRATYKKLRYASGYPIGQYSQAIPHMNSLVSLKDLGEELVHC